MRSGVVCAIAVPASKANVAVTARPVNPQRIALNLFMLPFPRTYVFIVTNSRHFAPDRWSSNSSRSDTHSTTIKPSPTML